MNNLKDLKETSHEIQIIEIEKEGNRHNMCHARLLLEELEELLANIEARIAKEVYFDAELKNDGQRKAALTQKLNADDNYHNTRNRIKGLQREVIEFEHTIKRLTIRIEAKKRMFDILMAEGK